MDHGDPIAGRPRARPSMVPNMTLPIGASASRTFIVGDTDTAIAMGSGDVPVLGTPRLIAWCEEVTVLALAEGLEPSATSVGYRIRVDHLAPTPVGAAVDITAEVAEVDGRQVTLAISATDGNGEAARGEITRVVVDRAKFVARATGSAG